MNREFVPYEPALALKELGFDEPCFGYYNKENKLIRFPSLLPNGEICNSYFIDLDANEIVTAPLYQQVFRWFREKYNLRGFIGFRPNVKKFDYHVYDMSLSGMEYVKQRSIEAYNKDPIVGTYEEAETACLTKLIEIVKKK